MIPTPSSAQEHCTVEHLAAVFGQCRDEILDEWQRHTNELLSALKLDHATLTNHVPDIVDEIIWDLSYRREGSAPKEDKPGSHPRHGVQRVTDGLNIGQVVAEYNLLRDAFFTVADHHALYLVGEAARIISHRIDDGVRAAVTAFAAQQARNLKAREEEHLAFVAHDLRTPINAIGLLIEELKIAPDENPLADTDETFELLRRNLERLSNQIRQVLEEPSKGRRTQTAFQPQCRTFELWPLVQALILDFRSIAAKDGIKVVNQIPPLLTVWADAELISQVFQNLLGNAFKHSPNGRIAISASMEAGSVTCRVQDTGTGIAPEMLAKVFDKHVTSGGELGAGLGLAIVKQIIEAHGGRVRVESTPGVGTSFSFTVPVPPES
jgi:two-component system, OmpR family, phosphate regulon sensor histidine kinase PhoR